jgi:hypothetical protein
MCIALSLGVLAFSVYLWQLSVPEFVGFYDSGVYLAATMHLVSGVLPYKDFVFVNPPGILILLSPVGILSRMLGSHDGLIVARVASSFVTAANVSLLAWLVRHRGRIAMLVAGLGLALLPVALIVSSGVRLEPYCILLILLGALILFSENSNGNTISRRSLLLGGLLFGLAGSVKLWAFFPFIAALMCLTPEYRKRIFPFVGAAAGGFALPTLPFLVIAPRNFLTQIFGAQFLAKPNPAETASIILRLSELLGFQGALLTHTTRETIIVWVVIVCLIIMGFWRRIENEAVDRFLLVSFVVTACGLLVAPASSAYYYYFSAPFLTGVVAVTTARLGRLLALSSWRILVPVNVRAPARWLSGLATTILVFALVLYSTTFFTRYASLRGLSLRSLSPVASEVPKGSCVLSDIVVFELDANRFTANSSRCPDVVDPYGVWQTWNNDYANPPRALVAIWKSEFERANYVVLNSPNTGFIPWNRSLKKWFDTNYHMISGAQSIFIYSKITWDH